jgi:hypothetical protein
MPDLNESAIHRGVGGIHGFEIHLLPFCFCRDENEIPGLMEGAYRCVSLMSGRTR